MSDPVAPRINTEHLETIVTSEAFKVAGDVLPNTRSVVDLHDIAAELLERRRRDVLPSFKVREVKAGEQLDAMTTAGEEMLCATFGPIRADLFDRGDWYGCPLIVSDDPGSGHLAGFLEALREWQALNKEVRFVNVINAALRRRVEGCGFSCVEVPGP